MPCHCFLLPTFMCVCWYQTLVVTNPDSVSALGGTITLGRRTQSSVASGLYLGASLACPPFCPGTVTSSVVPLPLRSSSGTFSTTSGSSSSSSSGLSSGTSGAISYVPARVVTSSGGGASLAAIESTTSSSSTGIGLYYTLACANSGLYTDPSTGACTNASDPLSKNCAFGGGDSCQRCPTGKRIHKPSLCHPASALALSLSLQFLLVQARCVPEV